MTIGYYAIRPPKRPDRPTTEPWPYCRACAAQPGMRQVAAIDETAHPSTKCRGCKVRLREWR
jgi:hypothetical protein